MGVVSISSRLGGILSPLILLTVSFPILIVPATLKLSLCVL